MDRIDYDWQDKLWAAVIGNSRKTHQVFNSYLNAGNGAKPTPWYKVMAFLLLTVVALAGITLVWVFLATHPLVQ